MDDHWTVARSLKMAANYEREAERAVLATERHRLLTESQKWLERACEYEAQDERKSTP